MKPMTHGEIRGTLMIAALLAAILVAVAVFRSCKSSAHKADGEVVEVFDAGRDDAVDSVIAADKAGAYLRADSLRKAERDSLRKFRRDSARHAGRKTGSDRKGPRKGGSESKPVKMNDSPMDREVPGIE